MLSKKVDTLTKAMEVEAKKMRREVTALEKEITVLRAEKEQERRARRSGLTKAPAVNGSSNHVLGRSGFCYLCYMCNLCSQLGLSVSLESTIMSHMWGFASSKMLGDGAPFCMWQCFPWFYMLSADYIASLCSRKRLLGLRSPRYWCSGGCLQKISTNASSCGQSVGLKILKLYIKGPFKVIYQADFNV